MSRAACPDADGLFAMLITQIAAEGAFMDFQPIEDYGVIGNMLSDRPGGQRTPD